MLVRRAGLYALGIVTSVAVGAGGAHWLGSREKVADAQERTPEGASAIDPGFDDDAETTAPPPAPAPAADVEVDEDAPAAPEPPPDRAEAPGTPPIERDQWLAGYWSWEEDHESYTWVSGVWYDPLVLAPFAPPRPRHEVITRAPSASYLYLPGYWRWGGQGYVWAPGRWARRRPGLVYVGPHWVKAGGRWAWRTAAWVTGREIATTRERERDEARAHREREEAHAKQVADERARARADADARRELSVAPEHADADADAVRFAPTSSDGHRAGRRADVDNGTGARSPLAESDVARGQEVDRERLEHAKEERDARRAERREEARQVREAQLAELRERERENEARAREARETEAREAAAHQELERAAQARSIHGAHEPPAPHVEASKTKVAPRPPSPSAVVSRPGRG